MPQDLMTQDPIHADIAFIRQTLEEGRSYVRLRSPDFAVWGALVALGYLGIYARVTGIWSLDPGLIWWPLLALGWLFSLRSVLTRQPRKKSGPAGRSLRALWLGFGISMMLIGILLTLSGAQFNLMDIVTDSFLGASFFASAAICGVHWLRWVAVGWWLAAILSLALLDTTYVYVADAGFMFALLCLPGLVLWLRPSGAHD